MIDDERKRMQKRRERFRHVERERSYKRTRYDAVCRETDGACDPAAMKGGGEKQVGKEEEEGGTDRHLPSEGKNTACENVHGGEQNKQKPFCPATSPCHTADRQTCLSDKAVTRLPHSGIPNTGICFWFYNPAISESS